MISEGNVLRTIPVAPSAMFFTGVVLVLLGLFLQLRAAHWWMRAEEHAKDGLLTEDQARMRIRFARLGGPCVLLLGFAAFLLVFYG